MIHHVSLCHPYGIRAISIADTIKMFPLRGTQGSTRRSQRWNSLALRVERDNFLALCRGSAQSSKNGKHLHPDLHSRRLRSGSRQNLIQPQHKDELQKYITGIVTNKGQKLIAINNMPDHFHLLICLKPTMSLSDLVAAVKASSSGV